MRFLHVVAFSKNLRWSAQTKVITLKTQLHAVNARWKRLSQRSFTFISLPWLRFLISNITTLLGTLCYKITRIYEFASFLSLFTYNQVPNNMLRICVTFIEENLFEIKFEITVFETKKRSRHPFRSTRFRESRYLYSRHQAFSQYNWDHEQIK